MAAVSFHLKDLKADKPTPVFIWFNADGQRTKIYTGDKIHPAQWDNGEQRAKTRGKGIDSDNGTLNASWAFMKKRLLTFYNEQRALGVIPSPESLRASIEPQPEVNQERPRPIADFAAYIERIAISRRPATVRSVRTTYNHLQAYEQHSRRTLEYDGLTAAFHDGFTRYLLQEVKLTDNSLSKQVAILKRFLQDAVDQGRTTKQDFKRWQWSRREPDILALTRQELHALEELNLPEAHYLNNARGLFLLSCYTGLRFSDVAALKPEHDRGDRIELTTQKTRDRLMIPMHPKARPLLTRLWAGQIHPITNQKLNAFLKDLAQRAGIDSPTEENSYQGGQRNTVTVPKWQLISSHTGRRTFVTLALESGLPWEVIMKATGHKDFKSFRRYIHVTADRQLSEFTRVWAEEAAATRIA